MYSKKIGLEIDIGKVFVEVQRIGKYRKKGTRLILIKKEGWFSKILKFYPTSGYVNVDKW